MTHLPLLLGLPIACLISACQHAPTRSPELKVPAGSELAVIGFRDCVVVNDAGCDRSGENAATQVASVLDDPPAMRAIVVARPVGPKDELSDSAAATFGLSRGYAYVANGVVLDFHAATALSAHEQRIGIAVHMVRTSDAHLVDSYICKGRYDNLTSLNFVIRSMARDFRDSLEGNTDRFNLLGKQSCDEP